MTQRFNNELWEIDPVTRKVKTKIAVGREPVSMAAFASDSCLLIANNLPEMPSTAYPIAVQLDMVDVLSKNIVPQFPSHTTQSLPFASCVIALTGDGKENKKREAARAEDQENIRQYIQSLQTKQEKK
mgnify:CR=1 FL=1